MYQRAAVHHKETEAMSKPFAKTQGSSAVCTRNRPDTSDIHSVLIDSQVLLYRMRLNSFDGPFPLLDIKVDTFTVLLPLAPGCKKLRSTVFKRFILKPTTTTILPPTNSGSRKKTPQALTLPFRSTGDLFDDRLHGDKIEELIIYSAKMIPQSTDDKKYGTSHSREIDGFM